jgi:Tat protein secretion system quality control protein TatD with DNase activity
VRLIDSHCHLNAERFAGDEEAILERAQVAGLERILVPGWNVGSSERALDLVARHPWLDASVGVHPHDAAKVDEAGWRAVVGMASDDRVVAIGETGLDYDRVFSPIPAQLSNLRRNLELAIETGKPAILHVRSPNGRHDAQDAILEELERAGFGSHEALEAPSAAPVSDRPGAPGPDRSVLAPASHPAVDAPRGDPADGPDGRRAVPAHGFERPTAVIHSFSGSVEYARRVLDMGLAISISGLAFRKGEESTAEVAPIVPIERLLVETDSPFLSPPGGPRGRNEPEWVRITAEWVAQRRADHPEVLGDGLVAAYDRVFRVGPAAG